MMIQKEKGKGRAHNFISPGQDYKHKEGIQDHIEDASSAEPYTCLRRETCITKKMRQRQRQDGRQADQGMCKAKSRARPAITWLPDSLLLPLLSGRSSVSGLF